ncbi:MAG: ferredoxin [Frankia sp.]
MTVRGELLDVPPDQVAPAREAVASCPEQAIELVED